jgi:hypothetical protein
MQATAVIIRAAVRVTTNCYCSLTRLRARLALETEMEMEAWAGYILWELAIVWRIVLGPNSDRCMEYLPCYCTYLSTSKAVAAREGTLGGVGLRGSVSVC